MSLGLPLFLLKWGWGVGRWVGSPFLRTLSTLWLVALPAPFPTYNAPVESGQQPRIFPLSLGLECHCLGTATLLQRRPGSGQDGTAGLILSVLNLQCRLLLSLRPHLFSRGPLTWWAGRPQLFCLPYRLSVLGPLWELPFPMLLAGRHATSAITNSLTLQQTCPQSAGPQPRHGRPIIPSQGFSLNAHSSQQPVLMSFTKNTGTQDLVPQPVTGPRMLQLHQVDTTASTLPSTTADTANQDMQALLADMQSTFLQQMKDLLGAAPSQLSPGPSVPADMGQDRLWLPSPSGDWEASRAQTKSDVKRGGESSRARSGSGDPSSTECRGHRYRGRCQRSASP